MASKASGPGRPVGRKPGVPNRRNNGVAEESAEAAVEPVDDSTHDEEKGKEEAPDEEEERPEAGEVDPSKKGKGNRPNRGGG